MLTCGECDKEIRGDGAFLPDDDGDFVCLPCFRRQAGFVPAPATILRKAQVESFVDSPNHEPRKRPRTKPTVRYVVSVVRPGSSQVRKKVAKKNLLTLHNLPPGSYSAVTR